MKKNRLVVIFVLLFVAVGIIGLVYNLKKTDSIQGQEQTDTQTQKDKDNDKEDSKEKPSKKEEEKTTEKSQPTTEDEQKKNEEDLQADADDDLKQAFAQEKESFRLILANVDNPLPQDFTVEVEEVQNGFKLDKRVAIAARQMIDDAAKAGVELMLCSAYRSVEKQTNLFEQQKNQYISAGKNEQEAIALTASAIAIPGTSEHQTGLAADIVTPNYQTLDEGFAETEAFSWLDKNAWKYGFILRYPEDKQAQTKIMYESWHYRYVGETNAKLIKESGLCLEEYLQQSLPEGFTRQS